MYACEAGSSRAAFQEQKIIYNFMRGEKYLLNNFLTRSLNRYALIGFNIFYSISFFFFHHKRFNATTIDGLSFRKIFCFKSVEQLKNIEAFQL